MYDMTLQSYDLFICTDLICINHNFCCNTILLNLRIFKKFFNFGFQLFSILGNDLRRTLLDKCYHLKNSIELCKNIFSKMFSLCSPCSYKSVNGSIQCFFKSLPKFIGILTALFHCKYLRISGKCRHTDIILNAKLFFHLLEIFKIFCCQTFIIL